METGKKGIIAAIIAAFFFGLGNPFSKLIADKASPFAIVFLITAIAALFIAIMLMVQGKKISLSIGDLPDYLALGILGFAIPALMTIYALTITSALNVLFLLRCEIFFVTIMGYALFNEKVAKKQVLGMVLGFIGVFVFATELSYNGLNAGDALVLLSSVFWASYVITVKKLSPKLPPDVIAGMRYWTALPFLGIVVLIAKIPAVIPSTSYFDLGIFALSTYVFGVIAYNYAIDKIGSWKAVVPTQLLSVIFGFIFTWLVLGETLSALKIAGGTMILAGTMITLSKEN
jgi:drug/metabolite transporter (DMT)-like permease